MLVVACCALWCGSWPQGGWERVEPSRGRRETKTSGVRLSWAAGPAWAGSPWNSITDWRLAAAGSAKSSDTSHSLTANPLSLTLLHNTTTKQCTAGNHKEKCNPETISPFLPFSTYCFICVSKHLVGCFLSFFVWFGVLSPRSSLIQLLTDTEMMLMAGVDLHTCQGHLM